MSQTKLLNVKAFAINSAEILNELEKQWRITDSGIEIMPFANDTSYQEIAEHIVMDQNGYPWVAPLVMFISYHKSIIGARQLCKTANAYFNKEKENTPLDILSVSAAMDGSRLRLVSLLRYYETVPNIQGLFDITGDDFYDEVIEEEEIHGKLIIPDEIKNHKYSKEEIRQHDVEYREQQEQYQLADEELPFLNRIDKYVPRELKNPEDDVELIYDLKTKDMQIKTIAPYEEFQAVFQAVMTYVNGVEYYHYVNVVKGDESEESFMQFLEDHIRSTYIQQHKLNEEDLPVLMDKLYRSLFQLYIVQDLIDDPDVTDVKITAPDSIRARVRGKAYISNISFIDKDDYIRFIRGIAIRNGISENVPSQTFTDTRDDNYILRFSLTSEYVNSVEWPYLHIRKVARKKLMGDDLIRLGMMDEKIRDYLLDCGKNSRGVVFAGPPGSGKTVCLNWFLESAYEQSAEILVIQENDELFAYRKGVMFEHVVNYSTKGQEKVNLEELGSLALVAGANVFIIGEAKGAEICSAITLSNSGCRTAITIHSPSSTETIDKMADLALRGYAQTYNEAKRMLKSFQTIVYLEDFKVKEISEITGYDEQRHEMEYKYIYRRDADIV